MLPKGFDEVIAMDNTLQHTNKIYTTSDIVEWFEKKGLSRGTASGTITRATDQKLLIKLGYGEYQINEKYSQECDYSSSTVAETLARIYMDTIDTINKAFPASEILDMDSNDIDLVRKEIQDLKRRIDALN